MPCNLLTIRQAAESGRRAMRAAGREERAAQLLLEHVTGMGTAQLIAYDERPLTDRERGRFESGLAELIGGRPLQYVTGEAEFYGRVFQVDPRVLIPRPETEELVALALARAPRQQRALTAIDIGTGSGAIAITLQLERPGSRVIATDLSPGALSVAQANARALGAAVEFRLGDMWAPLSGERADILVSNPPYIAHAERDAMSAVVVHEPESALFAEEEGLAHYKTLAAELDRHLCAPGLAVFEIGYRQGKAVAALFRAALPQAAVRVERDINGKDRIVTVEKGS